MRWKAKAKEINPPGSYNPPPFMLLGLCLGVLICSLVSLGGCASVVPRELRKEIDPSLSFQELKENPDLYRGRKVLLGGQVVKTENFQEETRLQILQKPLGGGDIPLETDASEGRFLVDYKGYLDPAIYRSGRSVTVVGEVTGEESILVGEAEFHAPIIASQFLYLWSEPSYDPYNYPYWYPYYYPYYPWYPYFGLSFGWSFYNSYPFGSPWYGYHPGYGHGRHGHGHHGHKGGRHH